MNYIDNWFHFYATTESFEVHRKQGLINPDSICFLKETGQVYTQNSFFGICRERYEKLEQLVLEHDAKIKNILGIEGSSVGDGIINNISDLISFLDGFTDEDNLKEFFEAMNNALEAQISAVNKVLSERITALEDEIHNDSESLHNTINAINSQLENINIRLDNHDTAISALNTALNAHIREYNILKTNYDNFKSYAETKFTAIDSSISSINISISTLQQEFINLDEKFDDVENEVSEVKSLLEDAKNLVRDLEDRFEGTLADFEQFKRDINSEIDDFKDLVGSPYGIAPLDGEAIIPSAYLPSYVDDVLEYATKAAFPLKGESGKIYVALDDNLTYRWSGSTYVEISQSLGLGETTTTAYPGNKGKKNADDIAAHKADTNNPHNVTKEQLGLDKVNNTSDADKPISIAQQAAFDVLTNSIEEHVTSQANPHNVTKEQVGLGNVDNTTDIEKPISKATQDVLDTKVDKVIGKGLSTNDFTNEDKNKVDNALTNRKLTTEEINEITEKSLGDLIYDTTVNYYVYWDGTTWKAVSNSEELQEHISNKSNPHEVTKTQIGLSDVDNTSDLNKPISIATQAALDTLNDSLNAHITDKTNPHSVNKAQVGLGNVDNTSDENKPISNATQNALDSKVDKVTGKSLSSNDFTDEDKLKLDNSIPYRKLSTEEINNLTSKSVGDLIYNTTINKYVYWNGTSWEEVGNIDLSNYVAQDELETEVSSLNSSLATKVDKVTGKGLSTNDFTSTYKSILDNPWGTTIE